ncbi:imidazole glycerol phosphate synthase subunit HisH [Guyparkeria hydrothermalis]|uniref:imidazole glycerol phosphate synthase subunit HisH n=1 Tax=Guyparkeria hydrothermalis TaxID=923 RepID=UPI002021CB38|nr:imidazole glycerol phosphate synthase subunit HisH [Guyparkeria hydrothermalis]MCL7745095.1 imidazole glycerol phosphate synthase subunit HisH [Guyparkeria hydrothermalis]
MQIAVVDYGMGNLRSVVKAIEHVAPDGAHVVLTDAPEVILESERVVFPGQGAAAQCMTALRERNLPEALREAARTRPFLGICMGMQVLLDRSEENDGVDLLGWFPGQVRRFRPENEALKVPQMGWNQLHQTQEHPLLDGIRQDARFYFVHSYYCDLSDPAQQVATAEYDLTYCAALADDYVFAIQAHPEKSADDGLKLLANFTRWSGPWS